ncbi:hypothetical protein ACFWAY_49490 [Rhodococcus sp. NPDC059968]|uniref:hypothetical protein n=1 Tax=Rhodococcus sp. NPDC059968 TaxID=3347017 RepID=UPI00366FEE1F
MELLLANECSRLASEGITFGQGVVTLFWRAHKAAELRRPTAAVDSAVGRMLPFGWEHRVGRPEMGVLPAEGTSGIA